MNNFPEYVNIIDPFGCDRDMGMLSRYRVETRHV